jgi:hypothetical protein
MRRKLLWRHPAWCGDKDSFNVSVFCISSYRRPFVSILDRADTTFSMYRDSVSHCIGFIWDASSTGRIPHFRCIEILYHIVSASFGTHPRQGGYHIFDVSGFCITPYRGPFVSILHMADTEFATYQSFVSHRIR